MALPANQPRSRRTTIGRCIRLPPSERIDETRKFIEQVAGDVEIQVLEFYRLGGCNIVRQCAGDQWHISISHPKRYPTWDEVAEARYQLTPHDITMAMVLPPNSQYVNLHPNCFHLHQIPNEIT